LKVLHIQKVAGIAGSENHLLTLLPLLRSAGFAPTMLALADGCGGEKPFVEAMEQQGIPTETLPIRSDVDPALVLKLARHIGSGNFRLVHTHLYHADLYGGLVAKLKAVPALVSTRHNQDPFRASYPYRVLTGLTRRWTDHVICISESVRNFCLTAEGVSASRLSVVYYGLQEKPTPSDRVSRNWPSEGPVLGMVARLIPQKGHSNALHALARLAGQFPTIQLVLVGEGRLSRDLAAQAEELHIQDRVQFLGYQPEAAKLMAGFDVFVHPSRWEGFGLVFLEAMNASLPIVATTVGAIPEIVVHGETGLLVPPDDPVALADAIAALLRDRDLARNFGLAGRQRAEREFTVERMVEQTAGVYRRVLEGREGRA